MPDSVVGVGYDLPMIVNCIGVNTPMHLSNVGNGIFTYVGWFGGASGNQIPQKIAFDAITGIATGTVQGTSFGPSDCRTVGTTDFTTWFEPWNETYLIWPESGGGGGATSSPYIIDVGSTVMLGAILAFLVAYWFVGLTRNKKTWNI